MCQAVFDAGYNRGYAAGLEDGWGEGLRLKVAVSQALWLLERPELESGQVGEAIRLLRAAYERGAPADGKGPPSVGEDEAGG